MAYFLYNVLLVLAFLVAMPLFPLLALFGPKYREGLAQRLGFYSSDWASSDTLAGAVWIHAASVGEVTSAFPLIKALKTIAPRHKLLLSSFTATGNRLGRQTSGADAIIFLPLDLLWIVRRALSRFKPCLLIVIETEIWPNLLREAYRLGIPTLLLSGRLSARSLPRYLRFRWFFAKVLGFFSAIGMQSERDAERIRALGAAIAKVSVVGSLKFAVAEAGPRKNPLHALLCRDQQWLVAGSTHRGEEEILLEAFGLLRAQYPKLSMVLAPRHPERFAEVEKMLEGSRFEFARRSRIDPDKPFDKDILLLDSVGELADLFALGDIAFVGGSLVDVGGHNVLEPARWHKPILFGPFMANFKSIAEHLKDAGAAIEVAGCDELAAALGDLLGDAGKHRQMGAQAAQVALAGNHAFSRNLQLAQRYL
jgi:3-deoxy-D-manno-octulosonic-acid transferase